MTDLPAKQDRQWWNPGENDQRDLSRFAARDKKERVQFGAGGGDSSIKNHQQRPIVGWFWNTLFHPEIQMSIRKTILDGRLFITCLNSDDSIALLNVCKLLSDPDLLVMSPHLAPLLKTAACLSLGTPLVVLILIAKKVTIVIFIVVNNSQITKRY